MATVADLSANERSAVRAEAAGRLEELHAVRARLLPDADDAQVLSELTMINSQIAAVQTVLADPTTQRWDR